MKKRNGIWEWHHGASNALECLMECGWEAGPYTDAMALRVARKHVAETGHTVTQSQTRFREIRSKS